MKPRVDNGRGQWADIDDPPRSESRAYDGGRQSTAKVVGKACSSDWCRRPSDPPAALLLGKPLCPIRAGKRSALPAALATLFGPLPSIATVFQDQRNDG